MMYDVRGLRLGAQFFAEDGGAGAGGTNTDTTTPETTENKSETQTPDIEKLIQSAVDRATQKLGTDNKNLRTELENLKKEKLSDEERKKLDEDKRKAELDQRDKDITDRENRLFAIGALKEAGLDDGSKESLELVNLVMGENEDAIKEKVKALGGLVKRMVESEVNKTFKANGRNPEKGGNSESIQHTVVTSIGKLRANRDAETNDVLSHYIGGKN